MHRLQSIEGPRDGWSIGKNKATRHYKIALVANSMGISDIAFTQNKISPLIFPMPLEYAGGSIMGIAIGLSWGVSLAKKVGKETWLAMPKI